MDVLYWLIPAVIIIGLAMVGLLIWAIKSGQYDDLEGEASRILMDDDEPPLKSKERRKDKDLKKI